MENKAITDRQIGASTEWNVNYSPSGSRLNTVKKGNKYGAWTARKNDNNPFLQIELGDNKTKVTRIATQGSSDWDEWVKTYKLQYSDDGVNFQYYREQGQTEDKVISELF